MDLWNPQIIQLGPLDTQASFAPVAQTGSRERSSCRCRRLSFPEPGALNRSKRVTQGEPCDLLNQCRLHKTKKYTVTETGCRGRSGLIDVIDRHLPKRLDPWGGGGRRAVMGAAGAQKDVVAEHGTRIDLQIERKPRAHDPTSNRMASTASLTRARCSLCSI